MSRGADALVAPVDLGDGVSRIAVPVMGLPVAHTLVYVVDVGDGLVLIDAGWDDDSGWKCLLRGFDELELDMSSVRGVILTHHHPDHAGLAGRVRDVSDAWIAMHEVDAELLRTVDDMVSFHLEWELENYRRAGASEAEVAAFEHIGSMVPSTRPCRPDRIVRGGDVLVAGHRRFQVIWTPGHTPGHMCTQLDDGRLFTGDHVLAHTTPHIGIFAYPLFGADVLGDYLRSLRRVLDLGVTEVFPAHEGPIPDLHGRVAEIIDHHEERLNEVRQILRSEATVWDVAAAMRWDRPWDAMEPVSRQLALAEAAAHVRHLHSRGWVKRTGPSIPEVFRASTLATSVAS